jgi:hypothetical protein
MRGNAAFFLVFLWFAATGLAAQDNGLILNRNSLTSQGVEPLPAATAPGDLLEFLDGSLMHGGLKSMDTASGLLWENPAAKKPIGLQPNHLDSIHFSGATPVKYSPSARFHFNNDDDILGSVTSLDDDHLGFSTWFGGSLLIPRNAVQTITFLSSNYAVIYEGPDSTDGWVVGSHNPDSWVYRDGAFVSGAPGSVGRDFHLTDSSTIEFDLVWSDLYEMMVSIYSDAVDHLDFGNSYILEFRHSRQDDVVSLRHVDVDRDIPIRNFGSAPINLAGKTKMRVTIQSNKEEGTIAVFIDNVLVKRWKDENGFSAMGGGVLFQQVAGGGGAVKLSNFKISRWQGRYEPETSVIATNTDVIHFINHDHAAGKITAISGGKVSLAMGDIALQIPIERITQINFATAPVPAPTHDPWEVRAWFPGGGCLSFQLDKWNDAQVAGRSAIFGPLAFQTGQIRQLEFNLDRPKKPALITSDQEFQILDE